MSTDRLASLLPGWQVQTHSEGGPPSVTLSIPLAPGTVADDFSALQRLNREADVAWIDAGLHPDEARRGAFLLRGRLWTRTHAAREVAL